MQAKINLVLLLFLTISISALATQQESKYFEIEGNINQEIEINFPYEQILAVSPANATLPEYIELVPKRFKLVSKLSTNILPDVNRSMVDELRTPFSNKYTHLLKINSSLVTFKRPNQFIFIEQQRDGFSIENTLTIQEMAKTKPNLQIIEDNYILIVLSDNQAMLVNQNGTFKQGNPFNSSENINLEKIWKENNTIFITFLENMAVIVSIEEGIIKVISKIDLNTQTEQIEVSAFQRGQYSKKKQQIWLVDQNKGLFLITINEQLSIVDSPILIETIKGCFELDTKIDHHSFEVLLTCKQDQNSNFILLLFDNDNLNHPFLLSKSEPYIQTSSASKYIFYKDYIFSQQSESLDIFTPARSVKIKDAYQKHWIIFAFINSFLLMEDSEGETLFVYLIHNGIIEKKQLAEQNYSLSVNSPEPVNETIRLIVSYFCSKKESRVKQVCESEVTLKMNIHNNIVSYVQYKSLNLALVLILSTTLVAIILLCRYKYKSIYSKAYQELKELTNPTKCHI